MKDSLDLESIINLLQTPNEDKLNEVFQIFVSYLESLLELKPKSPFISLKFGDKKEQEEIDINKIFDFGAIKINENLIELERGNEPFLIFILFRTANYIFLPNTVLDSLYLKIIVNLFIENQLKEAKNISNWKKLIRKVIANLEDIKTDQVFFDKIFSKSHNYMKFIHYIWENIQYLDRDDSEFFLTFYNRYADLTLEEIQNNDVIETIRVINEIFEEVKSYRALLDYQKYFKQFIENGTITTDLSLRRFTSNIQKIQILNIAPTFQVNWHTLNISNNRFFLKFHPMLKTEQITKIIEKFPFLIAPRVSQSGFSFELSGFFIIPRVYLNDLIKLLEKMEQEGYIIKKHLFNIDSYEMFTNLNFFRENFRHKRLINPNNKNYEKKYNLRFKIEYGRDFYEKKLSLEDFLILDKVRFFSYGGFGFERRTNTLKQLKEDLLIESSKQERIITELQQILGKFHGSLELKEKFKSFISAFKGAGFFYLNDVLNNIVKILTFVPNIFLQNKHLINSTQFFEFIRRRGISYLIEDNLVLKIEGLKKSLNKDFIPLFLKSELQYNKEKEKYELLRDLFNICKELMIFDLNSIKRLVVDPHQTKKIVITKREKVKESNKYVKERDITSNYVENKIDKYTSRNPPILKPNIQQSIVLVNRGRYNPSFLIHNTEENRTKIESLRNFFPKVFIRQLFDLFTKEQVIGAEFRGYDLTNKEKQLLFTVFNNLLKNNVIQVRSYFWRGQLPTFSLRSFYDLSQKHFFYTSHLYNEFYRYIQKTCDANLKKFKEITFNLQNHLWEEENDILSLVNQVSLRKEYFDLKQFKELRTSSLEIARYLSTQESFKDLKESPLFEKYIKSIRFIPFFRNFGFSQYYLYLRPINPNSINLKLLFTNTFQSIKFIGSIEESVSFLIKYIFPFETPNKSFLNWHLYSAKDISEYCLFSVKKIYSILHLDLNLTEEGWDFDVNNFKKFIQNILFNPSKKRIEPEKLEFDLRTFPSDDCLGPESILYKNLTEIYDISSINIKSLRLKFDDKKLDIIRSLQKKGLIFPYLKIENIGLSEKITLLVPDVNKEHIDNLIKIFSFFNLVKIYEIEGDYFVYGFSKEKKFENGLMVKIYFPFKHDIFRFIETFNLLFEFLQIDYFLIIDSIFDGTPLLKHVYGNIDFLKKYNPLKNLKWNEKDKIWMNHKLYNEKMESIYPDLEFKNNN